MIRARGAASHPIINGSSATGKPLRAEPGEVNFVEVRTSRESPQKGAAQFR